MQGLMVERCKHRMIQGTCAICNGLVDMTIKVKPYKIDEAEFLVRFQREVGNIKDNYDKLKKLWFKYYHKPLEGRKSVIKPIYRVICEEKDMYQHNKGEG